MARRLVALGALALACALLGGLWWVGSTTQQSLLRQLDARNREAAALLAVAAAAHRGELATLPDTLKPAAQAGGYVSVHMQARDGTALAQLKAAGAATRAPAWFVQQFPWAVAPGRAVVAAGDAAGAEITLQADTAWAHDALWDICQRTSWLLLALALAAVWLVLWAQRSWRRPLQAALAQAQALEHGRFIETDHAALPEVQGLTRSVNTTVRRLREAYAAQAEQVAALQRQAQTDMVSGLPLRQHFVGQLQQRLAEAGGPGVSLVLIRVLQLHALNPRLGHDGTDRLLGAVGDVLLTYVDRVPGTFAGRLNGSDFALCLPVAGVAQETAGSLRATLSAAPALRSAGADVAVGGMDGLQGLAGSAALAAADAALARAEAGVEDGLPAPAEGAVAHDELADGARAWRERISAALAEGRTQLGEFKVVDASGRVLHLECPLRVQLVEGGPYQVAERWLALARRSRLLPQVDLAAVGLALKAAAADGIPRAVHASPASLAEPGFIDDVQRLLAASPRAARLLLVECVEGLRSAAGTEALSEAVTAWQRHGVRVGVEHAGAAPQRLPALQAAGVNYVKVDARHLRGAASDDAVLGYAQSLVALIHGMGLTALAEGIDDEADLAALWALGFDGATGPAVSQRELRG